MRTSTIQNWSWAHSSLRENGGRSAHQLPPRLGVVPAYWEEKADGFRR